jgi:hypothetical protein
MLQRPSKPPRPESRKARRKRLRAERKRRHRERLKRCEIIAPVTIGPVELSWFVRIGWLTSAEADQGDGRLIGRAISSGLAASANG